MNFALLNVLRQPPNLSSVVRQLAPQHCARIRPQITPVIPHRLIRQLVDVQVHVPILPNRRAIRPQDTRIANEGLSLQRRGIVRIHSVVLGYQLVNQAIGVALKTVRVAASLSMIRDVVLLCQYMFALISFS